ncbi:MAG: HlyC/CorC family transporter [Butyrivibrio sp.]|nr:HlyC/CorC family transporter [Butyrivibrio sp.]
MDEGLPSVSIFAFFVVLIINVFVYGFGMALEHVSKDEIEKRSLEKKDKTGAKLLALLDDPNPHIEAMQILAIFLNMVLGGLVVLRLGDYIGRAVGFSERGAIGIVPYLGTGLLVALLIMSFGIIIPRRLAFRSPEKWAYGCYYPTSFFGAVITPAVFIAREIALGILYIFGIRGDDKLLDVTEEEIKSMVTEGQEQGVIQESEADMISNIFEFSDKEAQDIMTNRNAMVAIDANVSLKEAVSFMMDTNNSRFPVYLDDIDHIIGIMHIRDAMKKLSEETDEELPIRKIKGLLRQPKFVPETRNIDSLFHSMQSSKTQMVVVIDEYGQTAGLVTMEDILEEIVGNIMDEYDEDENYIKPTRNAGEFTVDGKTPLEVLEKRFKISFEKSEFETLNGFLISKLDRIPENDEDFEIAVDGYNFKILSVQNHMVGSVLLTKLPEETGTREDTNLEIAK